MPSFAHDIRPLFRDKDVRAMGSAFDLGAYADVGAHAQAIYDQLAGGRMPCDGAWPAERVALLREWMDSGHQT